ncbi:MAG: PKD domain-containing protein [bacterium]
MKKKIAYNLILIFTMTSILFVSCKKDEVEPQFDADFEYTGGRRPAPAKVLFKSESGLAETIHWDFGDGNESNERNPNHVYTEGGTYTVIMTATSETGETLQRDRTITVWGELEGWTLDFVMADSMAFYDNTYLGDFIYLYLLDHNGNQIDYTGTNSVSGYYITEDWDDDSNTSWSMHDFDTYPITTGLGKNITIKVFAKPEYNEFYDPEEDDELYSFTINSNEFIPEDEVTPFPTSYREENFKFGITWEEK